MAARSVKCTLTNQSKRTLHLVDCGLSWGIWVTAPPAQIADNQDGTWKSESDGPATGTEGWVEYRLDDVAGKFKFTWNNPFVGSNTYSTSAPPGYNSGHQGGSGNDASVMYVASKE